MGKINALFYNLFERLLILITRLGTPLAVLAWVCVFVGSIWMFIVLKKHSLKKEWVSSLAIGILSLIAHLTDYYITLKVCPDLSFEGNPIWCIVVEKMGLSFAKWYGLTGKILLAILSFQFFAYYLLKRNELFPQKKGNFIYFIKNFGKTQNGKLINLSTIINFFSFAFSLSGIFCFYIAFQNTVTDPVFFEGMPSIPIVIFCYLVLITILYLVITYLKFRKVSSKELI